MKYNDVDAELVPFTEHDRRVCREASEMLLTLDTSAASYLAGGLAGISGRVTADDAEELGILVKMKYDVAELPERIATKIRISRSGCWVWQGWCEKRSPRKLCYPKVWWGDTMKYTHRVVYELLAKPIPDGMQLDHLCRNPRCVNPEHLEIVTAIVNIRRGNTGQNMVARISCFCGRCRTCRNREYMRAHRARRRLATPD
jgi:hypothetical protein